MTRPSEGKCGRVDRRKGKNNKTPFAIIVMVMKDHASCTVLCAFSVLSPAIGVSMLWMRKLSSSHYTSMS